MSKLRRTPRGRKLTKERLARGKRAKNPIVPLGPTSTFDDFDLIKHNHNDDVWRDDCPACNR